jgi:dTDP-4-dehydrorhamnose reductase
MDRSFTMRLLVTGAAGLLGKALAQVFSESHEVVALTRKDGDITDKTRMTSVIKAAAPEVIVHAAAIPDVDECERNPELAWRVNAEATKELVAIAAELGSAFALISTDSVFDGKSERPYVESDATNPLSVYGRTKVAAEEHTRRGEKHWIFRVSVLFGSGKENFVNKAWRKAMGNEPYVVASDQRGTATYTLDAAKTMVGVIAAGAYGTFHVCNQGECTRYELARRAVELAGMDTKVVIGKTISELNRIGPRAKYSVMEMRELKKRGFALPRTWEEALRSYVETAVPVK